MPSVAQRLLLGKLRNSSHLEELQKTFYLTTGLTLKFNPIEAGEVPNPVSPVEMDRNQQVEMSLEVGSVHLGHLYVSNLVESSRVGSFQHLLHLFADALSRHLLHETRDHHPVLPEKVATALKYLRTHYQEAVNLHQVAKRVGLSEERLSRLFHESLGVTFSEYLNRLRLDYCRRALRESKDSITEIAFSAGYQSISQFNRRFRAAEGMTPRAYRAAG